MDSINSRLDQIENLLSPKQAAIAWLAQAQKFESPDEYSSWLVEQPPGDYPNLALARMVEASIRGHYRSDDPGRIEHAVYRAQQKVLFLMFLCISLWREVESRSRPIALMATLSWECVLSAPREMGNPTDFDRCGTYHYYFRMYAREVFNLKAAIEYLETKYFDGHPLLWKSQAEELDRHAALIDSIASFWNLVFSFPDFKERRGEGNGTEKNKGPRKLDFDLKKLKKSIDPIRWTRDLIDRAKAEALAMTWDTGAAIGIIRSSLKRV